MNDLSISDTPPEPDFIKEPLPKDKVYAMWLSRLDAIERSTVSSNLADSNQQVEPSFAGLQ